MKLKPVSIHQFHSGSACGDAITNSMFFIQKLLHDSGYKSEIYVEHMKKELKDKLIFYENYKTDKEQLLIIHHSFGHDLDDWLINLKDYKILVYHNITPEYFFPKESPLYHYSIKGKEQLKLLKDIMLGGIGDSESNTDELRELGYENTKTIPLLLDIDKIFNSSWSHTVFQNNSKTFNVLFVGRIAEDKCQHELIDIFNIFTQINNRDSRLILVGSSSNETYTQKLYKLIYKYGLQHRVAITGKVSDEELVAYYKSADVFLCMSEYEDFGVPLIESMVFDIPVIAYDSRNIRNALNGAGFLIAEKNYEYVAGFLSLLSKNKVLRRKILNRQRENIEKLSYNCLKKELTDFFNSVGIEISDSNISKEDLNYIKYQVEGLFDSSYSLALVNREMALALEELRPAKISLSSTERHDDFEPNKDFIDRNPIIKRLWLNSKKSSIVDVVIRNSYPPTVTDMKGLINILHTYAWEESAFPQKYVQDFNSYLDGITVTSEYVRKTLIDNGVNLPVYVTGVGADHVLKVEPQEYNSYIGKGFKFLHISSCFPRKGIDILLKAYTTAFTDKNDVSLIIKTFRNIHNDVENQIQRIKNEKRHCPEIILINKDLDDRFIVDLYKKCNVLVAPSRGEGFGLPMAEAMLFDIPVITTAYGGQTDFCKEDNSWLIDYEFARADTHMGLLSSAWVEPKVEHLIHLMKEIKNFPKEKIKERTEKAKQNILKNYKWLDCAKRLEESVKKIEVLPAFEDRKIKLGWISTWNSKCGIAEYSKYLIENLDYEVFDLTIFASIIEQKIKKDDINVIRCWENSSNKDLNTLINNISKEKLEALVIQFHFSFFELFAFGEMLDLLKDKGIRIFITFHGTEDIDKPDFKVSLSWIRESLKKIDRIFVHGISDLNRFKDFGITENVTLFPHGVLNRDIGNIEEMKKKIGFQCKTVISSYGFLLPHKGIKELIRAFNILQNKYSDLHLLLVNALYPALISEETKTECLQIIEDLNLSNKITMINDFLEDEESLVLLECSDMIVYPYQYTQESASGAVRFGLAANRPVICTPLDIFDDVRDIVVYFPGNTPAEISEGIESILENSTELCAKLELQKKWLHDHSWISLGMRLGNIIKSVTGAPAAMGSRV